MTGTHPTDTGPGRLPSVAELLARDPLAFLAPEDPLAVVIALHGRTGASTCFCGPLPLGSSHAEHVARAVREAGLIPAVVQPEATPDTDDEIERLTALAVDVWRSDEARGAAEDAYQANNDPSPVHGRDVGRLARMRLVVRAVLAARRSAGEA